MSISVATQAQPGTTITTTFDTCLPNACGDNSTTYNVIIGGIVLELIEATAESLVARFPEFTDFSNPADFVVSTQYQTFKLAHTPQFNLFLQTREAIVMPPQGQNGTKITITGTMLLGYGDPISPSRVAIGGVDAEILSFSQETIELKARSGPPGLASISINTTQSLGNSVYDGPYTFLEDVWMQLENGIISDIIPPAVQAGGSVMLCGSRLLGGGESVSKVILAQISSSKFSSTPTSSSSISLPGKECITAEVPDLHGTSNAAGLVSIVANTGALVQSKVNFTIAEIQEVTPLRGKPGEVVTIKGVALLSGYSSSEVKAISVSLNGVKAALISASSTEVIIRALEPSNSLLSCTGTVVIFVQGPGSFSFFRVKSKVGWTYESSEQIDSVVPTFGQFGTLLTITGRNLLGCGKSLTRATVGEKDATLLETTNTLVQLQAPDSAVGMADIVLYADNGAEVKGIGLFEFRTRGSINQVLPACGQNGTFGKWIAHTHTLITAPLIGLIVSVTESVCSWYV